MMSIWLAESTHYSTLYSCVVDTVILAGCAVESGQGPGNGATKCNKVQNSAGLRWAFGRRILGQSSNRGQDRRHAIVEWSTVHSPFFPPYSTLNTALAPGLQRGFLLCVSRCIPIPQWPLCYSGVFTHVVTICVECVHSVRATAGFLAASASR
jgi:hypothetical protein